MLEQLRSFLHEQPEAALFLCLAVGFAVGRIALGPIKLGGICGTLLAALLVGQLGIELSPVVKSFAFGTFIFALGFMAGPQLVTSFDKSALRIATLSLTEFVCVLGVVLLASWLLGLDPGSSAGLLAGGATESAVLGTASDALAHLDLAPEEIRRLQSNVATVYSISYLCGLVTIVLFTSQIAPRLLRIDLRTEATKLWTKLGGDARGAGAAAILPELVTRRFSVERTDTPTVRELERVVEPQVAVERITRGGEELTLHPDLPIRPGDDLLVVGHRKAVIVATQGLGRELASATDASRSLTTRDIVVHRQALSEQPLRILQTLLQRDPHASLQIERVSRGGKDIPILSETKLRKGDVVRVVGDARDIEQLAKQVGHIAPSESHTDLLLLAVGIILGYLIGIPRLSLGGMNLSLGTGGGALVSGLVFGWLHSKYRGIGTIPNPAAALLKDLGLATFIASVGLGAGSHALEVVRQFGWSLPVASLLVTLIPALISLLLGRHVLKLAPPILLGAVAGQQCSTPAINTVVGAAGNSTPMLGYTVTYALSNVLLPLLGPLLVALIAR